LKAKAHVYVSGNVQGVLFRSTTAQEARLLGVMGWVRNLPDGRVEAVFEGEKEAVQAIIEFCGRGPKWAKVTNVEVEWGPHTGSYRVFKTR